MSETLEFPYMEVDLGQIKENLFEICRKTQKNVDRVIAVVKDNSYGLGAAAVCKILQNSGVVWFAVAAVDEALFLRENGISGNILVLGTVDESRFEEVSLQNITLSVIDLTQISIIEKNYSNYNLKWHLNIDTGMRRDGISCENILENGEVLERLIKIKSAVNGVYTHYYSSDEKEQENVVSQQNKFRNSVSILQNSGFNFDVIHTSNSGACVYSSIAENEFIRPGILIYGCRPNPNIDPEINVCETVKICSQIIGIRDIKKDECVSYGHTWKAPKDTKIATVSIGYADGFPRTITQTAFVIINGRKYPIVGRITMDYVMVDIGEDAEINVKDLVIVAGESGGVQIKIDDLALNAQTIGYELLCKFGGLMNHKYILNGRVVSTHKRKLF